MAFLQNPRVYPCDLCFRTGLKFHIVFVSLLILEIPQVLLTHSSGLLLSACLLWAPSKLEDFHVTLFMVCTVFTRSNIGLLEFKEV